MIAALGATRPVEPIAGRSGESDGSPPSLARAIGPREFRSLAACIGPKEFQPFAEAIGPELPSRTVPVRELPPSSLPDPLPSPVRSRAGSYAADDDGDAGEGRIEEISSWSRA